MRREIAEAHLVSNDRATHSIVVTREGGGTSIAEAGVIETLGRGAQDGPTDVADLLGVSRSSIGNAIRQIRPLLHQAGHTSTTAPTRARSTAELLAHVTLPTTPTDTSIPTG